MSVRCDMPEEESLLTCPFACGGGVTLDHSLPQLFLHPPIRMPTTEYRREHGTLLTSTHFPGKLMAVNQH